MPDPPADPTPPTSPLRNIAAALVLIVGLQAWLVVGRGMYGTTLQLRLIVLAAVTTAVVWLIPPLRSRAAGVIRAARSPSSRTVAIAAAVIALSSTAYFYATSIQQQRELFPKRHDEFMHLLQIRMIAHGRLWMPQHRVADSFETFHVFVKPLYASIYFPGTAILYAPSIWLGLPYWVLPLFAAGALVGLTYWVTTHLIDGIAGALAVLLLLSNVMLRYLSVTVLSHLPMALLGMGIVWAWLMWRRRGHRPGWAVCLGVVAGWAAITRPADAVCYAIPIAIALMLDLRQVQWNPRFVTIGCVLAGAAPFLAIQVTFNWKITGDPFTTPYRLASDLYTPGISLGFRKFDPTTRPATDLPQWHAYYDIFTAPAARAHTPGSALPTLFHTRIPVVAWAGLTGELLLVFIPAALLVLGRRRWVVAAIVPLFLGTYAIFPYLLEHYVGVYVPVLAYTIVLGARGFADASGRARDALMLFATLAIAGFCIAALPQVNRLVKDDVLDVRTMKAAAELPKHVTPPAIVLFKFNPGDNTHEEPVYNVDVMSPDDAPIIRAQDLGPEKNRKLFRYYAERQPQRRVYRFDRKDESITPLGTVAELADAPE